MQPIAALTTKAELSHSVKITRAILKSAGYSFLKSQGEVEVYQKTVKHHSGFYKASYSKAHVAYLSVTSGDFDDDESEELLMREKRSLFRLLQCL